MQRTWQASRFIQQDGLGAEIGQKILRYKKKHQLCLKLIPCHLRSEHISVDDVSPELLFLGYCLSYTFSVRVVTIYTTGCSIKGC
jgi:hypothetical protein